MPLIDYRIKEKILPNVKIKKSFKQEREILEKYKNYK